MILTMVDPSNRLRVYRYDGKRLTELAALQAVTDDPTELAQIAATLAAMAGEPNGSAATVPPSRSSSKLSDEAATVTATPPKRKPGIYQKKKVNPTYLPDLSSHMGKTILALEESGVPMSSHDIGDRIGRKSGAVAANLSNLSDGGVVERVGEQVTANGRTMMMWKLTQHGHESVARARAHANATHEQRVLAAD